MSRRQSLETRIAKLIADYGLEHVEACIRMAVEMAKPAPEPRKRTKKPEPSLFTKESA